MKDLIVALLVVGVVVLVAIIGANPIVRREELRCHRWYSAASTARDSLWVTVLRPECAELLPPRKP